MKSYSNTLFHDKIHSHNHRWFKNIGIGSLVPFVLSSLLILSTIFMFFLNSPKPLSLTNPNLGPHIFEKQSQKNPEELEHDHTTEVSSSTKSQKEQKSCDLFNGRWIPSLEESSYYTNSSCRTIPESKNCFKNGRMDRDFLKWKWKPDQCELPRFNPRTFLQMVRGKKMSFIGDSVARNHMDSLLCLLSQEETPNDVYKDSEDRYRTWYFPNHNFTLMVIWSRFLIVAEERIINGSGSSIFDLHLDKVDTDWSSQFHDLDYAIISDGHWFFRQMYLHKGDKLIGCVFCNEPNVTNYNIKFAFRMAFRTSLRYISKCKNCKKTLTLFRTFAPAHFDNGVWNNGGYCNRTSPVMIESAGDNGGADLFEKFDWLLRNVQMEEFERVMKKMKSIGLRFEVLDVTKAMLMRPDGHPGEFWGNKWMKGYNDCTHWCLPGPVDMWSELLLAVLKREEDSRLSSEL